MGICCLQPISFLYIFESLMVYLRDCCLLFYCISEYIYWFQTTVQKLFQCIKGNIYEPRVYVFVKPGETLTKQGETQVGFVCYGGPVVTI